MKKTLWILAGILTGLFILFSILDNKSEYSAERSLWRINSHYTQIAKDPKVVPEGTFNGLVKQYEIFMKQYPHSRLVPIAKIFLGRVYVIKKDYPTALLKFEEIVNAYAKDPYIAVEALADMGQVYLSQEDGASVLKTYGRILKEYPRTELGLKVPLLIAKFHSDRQDREKAEKAFADAIHYYQNFIDQNPNSQGELDALRLLASCYLAQKKWEEGVETLGDILLKYSLPPYFNIERSDYLIKSINTISVVQLKNYDLPIGIYRKFIEQHPKHPMDKLLTQMIDSLQGLKERNIHVVTKESK